MTAESRVENQSRSDEAIRGCSMFVLQYDVGTIDDLIEPTIIRVLWSFLLLVISISQLLIHFYE
jgi:hypothetical protein